MTLLTIKPGRGIRYLGKFEEPEGDFIRVHDDRYIAHIGNIKTMSVLRNSD